MPIMYNRGIRNESPIKGELQMVEVIALVAGYCVGQLIKMVFKGQF